MTELLPIIFVRGQNEAIDPRVAPPDVHAVVRNVRWRKDGRPAKRYGVATVTTTGLAPDGFISQPVNAIAQWNNTPVIAVGSAVRQLGPNGWNLPDFGGSSGQRPGQLSHFGPGERDVIARDETGSINNGTSGQSHGMVLTAWESGGDLYYAVKSREGRVLVTPTLLVLGGGSYPRAVSTDNFIYVIHRVPAGTTLNLLRFNPSDLTVTAVGIVGTLNNSGCFFDAVGRGSDFAVVHESAPGNVEFQLYSAIAFPAQTATQTGAGFLASTPGKFGIASDATGQVFAAVVEPLGRVVAWAFSHNLGTFLGGSVIETDANNGGQPGLVLESNTAAQLVWGGYNFAFTSLTGYMRACRLNSAAVINGTIGTYHNVEPASKPFMGPAWPALGFVDGGYVWVSTHNANQGASRQWDTQRAYYLMKYLPDGNTTVGWLTRQLHVPNVPASPLAQDHLSDVLPLGGGFGFLTPLMNAVRFGNGQNNALGVDTVTVHSIFGSPREAARDTATAGRALHFSGGSLYELVGGAEESGFSNFPVIHSITGGGGGGGGLTNGSIYIYRAVYEWLDDQGRRHRSAPSDPITFANGANNSAVLALRPLIASARNNKTLGWSPPRGVTIHVYRSLAGGSTLHRVTPNLGAPAGFSPGTATVPFTDTMPDTIAGGQEFLYTEGGVADNTLCPPHTFMAVCAGRLWVAGQLDRCVGTASKLLVDGEPTQFSDLEQFSVFLPDKWTGIASIDGTIVCFCRERIFFVSGDGPNDQGVGEFSPPTELPTDVGCIDWRSVVETSAGVFFQGLRGIYLLPRGFNTPQFIGADVESTLAAFPIIVSATVVSIPSASPNELGEVTVRFVACASENQLNSAVLVYDLRTGGWSVDERGEGPKLGGTWGDAFITARETLTGELTLQSESAGAAYVSPFGSFIISTLGTGDIRPFGVAGYGGFAAVVLVGEYRGPCRVNVQVSVDGDAPDLFSFPVTGPDGIADNSVYLDVTPRVRLGSAIRVTCSDAAISGPSEGVIMQALFIEHDTIGKTKRLAAARRL